ncbi:expressed unknown protein [Seminavis robusta]|uniref:Uncharacterized protein n=1 Tax=Seminavis robusta TaxID=568900 RepID=A0A9N8F2M4_9STRA|nr:expressed unknown protein [Seminavis robusta]|eukprot:Sro2532_g330440.1 n/a (888) ;mRNA; f:5153-8187
MASNDEIDSLVNKYSSSSSQRRPSSQRFNSSTGSIDYQADNSNNDINFGSVRASTTAEAFPGDKFVMRRHKSKRDKKKKSKRNSSSHGGSRRSSSSHYSKSTSSLMTDPAELVGDFHNNNNNHYNNNNSSSTMDGSGNNNNKRNTNTRASVSPSYYTTDEDDSDHLGASTLENVGNKYVLPPKQPEPETHALLSSDMADPNDPLGGPIESFQDEFDAELDDISMRDTKSRNFINLSELEARNTKSTRTRCRQCITYIFILAIIGAVVGIVVYTQTSSSKNDDDIGKIPQQVPKTQARLVGLYCHEGEDLGPGQSVTLPLKLTDDCKNVCRKAECCWNPHGQYACTTESRDNCVAYKECQDFMIPHTTSDATDEDGDPNDDSVIPNEMDVPAAPATLKTTCVPIGADFTATQTCFDICERASCCWNSTSDLTCTAASFQANCAPYEEHCSFFNDHPHKQQDKQGLPFAVAPSDLESLCDVGTMEELGMENCEKQCNLAECCWKVGTVNCESTVPDNMCEPYAKACAVLNTIGQNSVVNNNNNRPQTTPRPTSTPRPAATPQPAPTPGSSSSSSSVVPEAPNGLDVYCDPSEMEEISLHICEDKCSKAECCWSTSSEACPSSVQPETCQPYVKACAILNDLQTDNAPNPDNQTPGNNNNVPQASGDFSTRCSKENIIGSSDGGQVLIQCERECLAASCCWQPNSQSCTSNARCSAYEEPCSIFVGLFEPGGDGTPGNGGVPQAPGNLAATCAPDVLTTSVNNGAAIVECEKECLAAACCWKDTHDTSCPSDPNCSAYMEPCGNHLVAAIEQLEGTASVSNGNAALSAEAREIADACNTQVAFFVKTRCDNACHPGACCFDDSATCGTEVDCGIYDPCSVLHRNRHNLRH